MNLTRVLSDFILLRFAPRFSPILDHLTYKTLSGKAKGFKRKGGLGFLPLPLKPTREEQLLASLDLTGKTVYDVGASIGILTLFFAARVGSKGKVLAFEPNPKSYRRAWENVQLNRLENVKIIPVAVGSEPCVDELFFPASLPGVGSLAKDEKNRIANLKDSEKCSVTVESIDHLCEIRHFPVPNLIKIDTQGFEREALYGAENVIRIHKPDLFVEVHSIPLSSWRETNLKQIISMLSQYGYRIVHVESGQDPNQMNLELFQPDEHLYCRFVKH